MSRQVTPTGRRRHADRQPVGFDDLEIVACVYGPRSGPAELARMQSLGPGWAHGIAQWRESGKAYLLLVARSFGGGSLGDPTAVVADERDAIERAIWVAMAPSDRRLCLLESFEPELVPFVRMLIDAARLPPGHA